MASIFWQLIEHIKSYPTHHLMSRLDLWLVSYVCFSPDVSGCYIFPAE